MTFRVVKPFRAPSYWNGSGARISQRASKRSRYVTLSLTADFQNRFFGGACAEGFAQVEVGRAAEKGLLRISLCQSSTDHAVSISAAIKGSVRLKIESWDLLPKEAQPASDCHVRDHGEGFVILALPDWCKPEIASDLTSKSR